MSKQPDELRLAVIKPGAAWTAWERAAFRSLADSPHAGDMVLFLVPASPRETAKAAAVLAARVGARYFRKAPAPDGDAARPSSCVDLKDLARQVEAAGIDLLVWLGLDGPPSEVIEAAREGCLSVCYQPDAATLDGRRKPFDLVALQGLCWRGDGDGPRVIAQAVLRPPREKGPRFLIDSAFNLAPALLARSLAEACFRRDRLPSLPVTAVPAFASPPAVPGRAFLLANSTLAWVRRFFYSVVFHEVWALGLVQRPIRDILAGGDLEDVRWCPAPARLASLADPWCLESEDGPVVIAEYVEGPGLRGRIVAASLADITSDAQPAWQDMVREDHHLSFPMTFSFDGTQYMVPEAQASGHLWAYRLRSGPARRWERLAEPLLDGVRALDPVVCELEGRWWLLAGIAGRNPNVNLYAWFAECPLGPWTAHPLNPVKSDVRSSRGAGPLFRVGDALYRPAQDCSETYGGALVVNRLQVLSPTDFREEIAQVFRPAAGGPYGRGLHSLCPAGEVTLVDGKEYRFSLWHNLKTLVGRIFK